MDLGLSDKVAAVAASSRGIGRGIAEAMAKEGTSLAICARNNAQLHSTASELRSKTGAKVLPVQADLSSQADIEKFINATVNEYGTLDILVTNASGPPKGLFPEISENNWHAGINLTLMSVVRLVQAALPHMRENKYGRIINVASFSVKQPIKGLTLSNSLRMAVVGLAKTLANELVIDGITVNTIGTGWTDTDSARNTLEKRALKTGSTYESERARVLEQIPLGRFAKPEEVGALAAFLASDRAGYITGSVVMIDGGIYKGSM